MISRGSHRSPSSSASLLSIALPSYHNLACCSSSRSNCCSSGHDAEQQPRGCFTQSAGVVRQSKLTSGRHSPPPSSPRLCVSGDGHLRQRDVLEWEPPWLPCRLFVVVAALGGGSRRCYSLLPPLSLYLFVSRTITSSKPKACFTSF